MARDRVDAVVMVVVVTLVSREKEIERESCRMGKLKKSERERETER